MSQFTPPYPPAQQQYGQAFAPPPRRGNGAAVASLVFGILGCIPLLSGFLAVICGILGMRKARDPGVGGKGMAVTGLILGVLSLLGWGGMAAFSYSVAGSSGWRDFKQGFNQGFSGTTEGKVVAEQFMKDVSAGKIDAALANSTGFTSTQLQADSDQWAQFGTFRSFSFNSFNIKTVNGNSTVTLGGTAMFSGGTHLCTITLVKQGSAYKVSEYAVRP